MTLPQSYSTSSDEYIRDAIVFLNDYQWIYNFNNTHILVCNVLSKFPPDWVTFFNDLTIDELNLFATNQLQQIRYPKTLKEFIDRLFKLKPNYKVDTNGRSLLHGISCVSKQKHHEISSLAPIIHDICNTNNTDFVIDVGSGLGYLPHILNDKFKHRVLGIECKEEFVKQAYNHQKKFYPQCRDSVKFSRHFINKNSNEQIKSLYEEQFGSLGNTNGCLTGLHACADLSIVILDIFEKLEFVKQLVIMPCCYHRIDIEKIDGDKEYFRNFPVSQAFKKMYDAYGAATFLRRPFLRLSCQQSLSKILQMTEEECDNHSRNLIFRAIVQDVVHSAGWTVKRIKRKSITKYNSDPDAHFLDYIKNLIRTHELEDLVSGKLNTDDGFFVQKMNEKWMETSKYCRLFQTLSILQAMLQDVCENFILFDRIKYLEEKGCIKCEVRKVTNDVLSPRCFALIASK